ncbi:MAG: immune inhibitor A [Chloroflexi bacterium]|nr:immune inhibitor A [Chloroflexota bacterium]
MNRKILVTLIVVLSVCIGLTVIGTIYAVAGAGNFVVKQPGIVPTPPNAAARVAAPVQTPLANVSLTTADALRRADIPERNLYQIVPALRKNLALLTPVPRPAPRSFRLGDRDNFFVIENAATGKYRTVTATLQVAVPHGYYWVEDGITVDLGQLQQAADFFERTIYPTNRKFFGNEATGLDGNDRIHILNTRFQDAAGYFSSEDTYPRNLVPFSNERNLIYLNIEAVKPGSEEYSADTAHEFQHLIHSYQAQHKSGWIDEGMADLAIKVNGLDVGGVLRLFARNPDTQLNTWANEPQASLAHYAASYLFFNYTAQRFGPDFTRDVIHAPAEGINGVQQVLDQRNLKLSFDDLFADWAVANYLNDPAIENGRYGYANERGFQVANQPVLSQFPLERSAQMRQYAANYYGLQPAPTGDVTVYFTGTTTAKLLAADAYRGRWMWYSNRADLADMTLTREVNLTQVNKATLQFWTWYDIERNFDYGYVEASTDGGRTWDILAGQTTTTDNPNGASYGHAFSGRSGAADDRSAAQWVQEQVDLTAFAGKTILLRFQYITDDAYNAPGWAIDEVSIPEINFADSFENEDSGWQAKGFVRSDNVLPQKFTVQVVQTGGTTRVVRVPMDDQNRGNLTITGLGKEFTRAELIITAHAPTTTEPTQYQFAIVPK